MEKKKFYAMVDARSHNITIDMFHKVCMAIPTGLPCDHVVWFMTCYLF